MILLFINIIPIPLQGDGHLDTFKLLQLSLSVDAADEVVAARISRPVLAVTPGICSEDAVRVSLMLDCHHIQAK